MTASAWLRMAVSIAPWTFSGEPSVATWSTVQPRSLAAAARIGPWTAHASTPQLTKVIFLPVGIGLPTGVVTLTDVGRTAALAIVALAASRPAESTPEDVPVALLDEPQAEATRRTETAQIAVATHFARLPAWVRCADMILTFCVNCLVPRRLSRGATLRREVSCRDVMQVCHSGATRGSG